MGRWNGIFVVGLVLLVSQLNAAPAEGGAEAADAPPAPAEKPEEHHNWASKALTSTKDWVEGAAVTVGSAVGDAGKFIGHEAAGAGKWVGNAAEDTGKWIGGAAESSYDWVKHLFGKRKVE